MGTQPQHQIRNPMLYPFELRARQNFWKENHGLRQSDRLEVAASPQYRSICGLGGTAHRNGELSKQIVHQYRAFGLGAVYLSLREEILPTRRWVRWQNDRCVRPVEPS